MADPFCLRASGPLGLDERRSLLAQLREGRAKVLADAEAFAEVLFVFERLGMLLSGKADQLGTYRTVIGDLARSSPLAESVPTKWREFHTPFVERYTAVQRARNDALHHGAAARHLADSAVWLSLTLEDALMTQTPTMNQVGDFMVRDPVIAHLWQPVAYARQVMLATNFSYLPILDADHRWCLLSDAAIAHYLRSSPAQREARLAHTLAEAIGASVASLRLSPATTLQAKATVGEAVEHLSREQHPVLVVEEVPSNATRLLGTLSAFDCL